MKEREPVNPRVFLPMAALGIAIMGFGVYGLFENSARTHPGHWVMWFFGAAIAHDFVLAPTVAIVGVVAARQVPSRYRPIVQGALIASGIVVLTAYPFVRGYGRQPSNPTVLPNNYLIGLLVVLSVIWVVAGALAWRAHRRGVRAKTKIN
jgi:hypothetical protein